ncbi:MAG: HAD family phosphatase [Ferruginibacter sp.]
MGKIKAFLFDLNGTMIDDMQYHIEAWYRILNDLGANISMERMKLECYGKNVELLERIFPGRFNEEEKNEMSLVKEAAYQKTFMPHLKLIDGLDIFLKKTKDAGIKMAIGSAAIMYNIDFVLDNLSIRHYFNAIVSADDVVHSKPDPETYLKCAEALGVEPSACIVFEDVPKGVESAANAGMQSIIIKGGHTEEEFAAFDNVIAFIDSFNELLLENIFHTD